MLRLSLLLLLVGCAAERDPAPPSVDDMNHAMFRVWEDDAELREVTLELVDWLDRRGRSDNAWEGLRLTNLTEADLVSIEAPPGIDLSLHTGIATAGPSAFPILTHANAVIERDQVWTDPASFEVYSRDIFEGDPQDFTGCDGYFRSDNDILKGGPFGVEIPYEMRKDYKWVPLEGDRKAFVARHWVSVPGCSPSGSNCLHQSFGLDVFVEDGDETVRMLTNWLFVETVADALLSEDARIGLIATGQQDVILAADEELAERAAQVD